MSQEQVQTMEKRRGRPFKADPMAPQSFSLHVTVAQDHWLRTEAARRGVSVAAIVRACISGYMPDTQHP